jgi:uncharacterized protein YbjT (DUF2867 family)
MENALKKSNLNYTILRSMFFMENFLKNISTAKVQGKLAQSLHEGKFCPISVRDIGMCEAYVLMNPKEHISRSLSNRDGDVVVGMKQSLIIFIIVIICL